MQEIPYGFCQCGCGKKTNIIHRSEPKAGRVKGAFCKFLSGHSGKGPNSWNWKGGISIEGTSPSIKFGNRRIQEHVMVAEIAMGKKLPEKAVVHHVDRNRRNSENSNLVVCQDQRYHYLLHVREAALKNCGNASWRKCPYCHTWDDTANMTAKATGHGDIYQHISCRNLYARERGRMKRRKP